MEISKIPKIRELSSIYFSSLFHSKFQMLITQMLKKACHFEANKLNILTESYFSFPRI